MQACRHVDGRILWANLHLLFWLSLTPFVSHWMGETRFAPWPVALYGAVLLLDGVAYRILVVVLIARHGRDSALAAAVGGDFKGKISVLLYAVAIPGAFFDPRLACAVYVAVAIVWLVPDRRIEKALAERQS